MLQNLRKKKDLVTTKPNKGNGIVILNRKLYNNTIQEIISHTSKFKKVNEGPTLKREASLQRFLHKLNLNIFFKENEHKKLYSSGSAPARIYSTPKMHRLSCSNSFPELRPIVSFIGTFNYNFARFLCDLLSPLAPNDYCSKDSFALLSQIKNANISRKFFVSYDVTSPFTNISLQETIDIAKHLIFNQSHNLIFAEKNLKNVFLSLHHRLIFFLIVKIL